jgi:hypothetical protein
MPSVYILRCADDSLYVGVTNDLADVFGNIAKEPPLRIPPDVGP